MHVFNESNVFILFHFLWGCYGGALVFLGGAGAPASPSLSPPMVCRAAYTILLKYAGIAAIHILFMIANSSVPRAMQFAVTGRVRTSFLALTRF